jgi:lysophospholipase L1-like esterase
VLERIPEYIRAGANAAETHRCTFLDLHAKVQHLLRRMRPDRFAEDAVHPTPAGALFIAEAVYAALSGEL